MKRSLRDKWVARLRSLQHHHQTKALFNSIGPLSAVVAKAREVGDDTRCCSLGALLVVAGYPPEMHNMLRMDEIFEGYLGLEASISDEFKEYLTTRYPEHIGNENLTMSEAIIALNDKVMLPPAEIADLIEKFVTVTVDESL